MPEDNADDNNTQDISALIADDSQKKRKREHDGTDESPSKLSKVAANTDKSKGVALDDKSKRILALLGGSLDSQGEEVVASCCK